VPFPLSGDLFLGRRILIRLHYAQNNIHRAILFGPRSRTGLNGPRLARIRSESRGEAFCDPSNREACSSRYRSGITRFHLATPLRLSSASHTRSCRLTFAFRFPARAQGRQTGANPSALARFLLKSSLAAQCFCPQHHFSPAAMCWRYCSTEVPMTVAAPANLARMSLAISHPSRTDVTDRPVMRATLHSFERRSRVLLSVPIPDPMLGLSP
jgi:hypothetical protein